MAEEKKVTKNVKAPKKSSVFSKKVEPKKAEPKKVVPKDLGPLGEGKSVVTPDGSVGTVVEKEQVTTPSGPAWSSVVSCSGSKRTFWDKDLRPC